MSAIEKTNCFREQKADSDSDTTSRKIGITNHARDDFFGGEKNLRYLELALRDCGLVELCHITQRRVVSSYHTELGTLLEEAERRADTGNLFTTIQHPDKEAIARYLRTKPTGRTKDAHITGYRRLFFDFDVTRPRSLSATEEELTLAKARSEAARGFLDLLEWPKPAIGMSGNGAHLQYRCAMPASPEVATMLDVLYKGLGAKFTDEKVSFDTTVRNPARLATFYGSTKRKGPDTPERPHRQSGICLPPSWEQVSPRQIARLAERFAKEQPVHLVGLNRKDHPPVVGRGDYRTLDVTALFAAHGAYRFHIEDHKHSVWCPWSVEHTSDHGRTGAIVFEADGGWPGFSCRHHHCKDRDIRDVLALWRDAERFCLRTWGGSHV